MYIYQIKYADNGKMTVMFLPVFAMYGTSLTMPPIIFWRNLTLSVDSYTTPKDSACRRLHTLLSTADK